MNSGLNPPKAADNLVMTAHIEKILQEIRRDIPILKSPISVKG